MKRPWTGLLLLALPWLSATPAVAEPTASTSASSRAPQALEQMELPTTPSPMPKLDEWKQGEIVTLASGLNGSCATTLVREWLRIRCKGIIPASGAVLSGPSKEVLFYMTVPRREHGFPDHDASFIDVVMPLRPRESRLVQLTLRSGHSYEGFVGQEPWLLLSQEWPAKSKGPILRTDLRRYEEREFFGMRIGNKKDAEALGLRAVWSDRIVLSVEPGSPAEKGGAKPGDNLLGHFGESLALDEGTVFSTLVMRDRGTTKQIYFQRRQGAKW